MSRTVNLTEEQHNLPDLADQAHLGETIIVANDSQELAVIISIEEYRRLKHVENEQRDRDFDALLAPPGPETVSVDEAQRLAVEAVREYRVGNLNR